MNNVSRPHPRAHAGDYEVGRGRPPVHSRFKPGQCGNPKGRGKGVRNFATDVKAALKAPVRITRDGKRRTISTQQAMILRLREMALAGNGRAIDRLVQLAQIYNNEDFAAVDGLSVADAAVLTAGAWLVFYALVVVVSIIALYSETGVEVATMTGVG